MSVTIEIKDNTGKYVGVKSRKDKPFLISNQWHPKCKDNNIA